MDAPRDAKLAALSVCLVLSLAAPSLCQDVTPPRVTDVRADGTPLPGAILTSAPSSIVVTFSEDIDPATVSTDTFRLVRSGGDGTFTDGNEVEIVPTSVTLDGAGTQATMELTGVTMADDDYRVTVSGGDGSSVGLVGHWKFDEGGGVVAADSSVNSNDGSLNGGSWVVGMLGGALHLDGNNDYVSIADASAVRAKRPMSLAAWVKRDAVSEQDWIAGKIGDSGKGWSFTIENSDRLRLTFRGVAGVDSSGAVSDTDWHHVAATTDASGAVVFYIDGANAGASSIGNPSTTSSPLRLGVSVDANGNITSYDDFAIDDLRIYNRALSPAEVAMLAGTLPPVSDLASNPLDGEYSGSLPSGDGTAGGDFVCTFRIDTTAPAVSGTPPLEGATDVSISTEITITFAEEMDQAATEAAFSTDPDVPGTFSWSESTLTFTPSGDLDDDTTYTVTISTGATDLAGHALAQAYTFTFTTEDLTAPADVSNYALAPSSEQIDVTWRNPYDLDFAGVVILRSVDEAPTGSPSDGTTYAAGNVIENAVIVYVGEGATAIPGNRSSWQETGLENGREYQYAVFTYDEKLNYSPGVTASAIAGEPSGGGDGGLCSPGSSASPILLALTFALAAFAALARRQLSGT